MDEQQKEHQRPLTFAEEVEQLGWTVPLPLLERWCIGDSMPESMNGYRIYPNGGTEGMTIGEYLERCEKKDGVTDLSEDGRPRPVLLTEDDGGMAKVAMPGRGDLADED